VTALILRAAGVRWFVPAMLLAGALARLLWIVLVDAKPIDDFSWYFDRAVDLAAGRGLIDERGEPTAYWPVGYPLMLAGLFRIAGVSLFAAKLANVALYAGAMLCAYFAARHVFAHELTARLTLAALAVYPNHVAYASLTATETPFLFLLLLGTLLLLLSGRVSWLALAAGVVFGLGCLTKPTMLFVPAVVLWSCWFARDRRRLLARGLMVSAALVVTVAPWIARNARIYGTFVFINNNGGINLLIGNNPHATGGYRPFDAVLTRRLESAGNEQQRDALAGRIAKQYILDHPARALARLPMKAWYLYHKDVEGFYWNEAAIGRGEGTPMQRPLAGLKIAAQLAWLATLGSFAAGLLRLHFMGSPPRLTRRALLGPWIILYFTLITLVMFGSTRLHFPLVPFLLFHAAAWWSLLLDRPPVGEARSG